MRRLRLGRVQLYIEPRDLWVGAYVAPDAVYVCPLPLVVIKVDRSLRDRAGLRLVPPPKEPRWHIVAVSTYPSGGEQVIGGYRSRRVATWIAGWLPKRTGVRLEVRPAGQGARATETTAPGGGRVE